MARHAEKKATENAAYWSSMFQVILAFINVIYVVSMLYSTMYKEDAEWSYWAFAWPFIYAYLEYKAYLMVVSQMQMGVKLEYSLDLFIIIASSHFLAVFNDTWATYVLYLVPTYLAYKLLVILKDYLKSKSDQATSADPEDADS